MKEFNWTPKQWFVIIALCGGIFYFMANHTEDGKRKVERYQKQEQAKREALNRQ